MKRIYLFLILVLKMGVNTFSQDLEKNVQDRLEDYFAHYSTASVNIGKSKLKTFEINHDKKLLNIYASKNFAYQPFREETVEGIYRQLSKILPGPVNYYSITLYTNGKPIEELIPNIYRIKKKDKSRLLSQIDYKDAPWVTNISLPYEISKGLQNRHIALWQSHGKYFKKDQGKWQWQRPRLFCTTEDLYTQSIVLPYLIPMLENAGAIVFTPRERDVQRNEVIVDNDTPRNRSVFLEKNSRKRKWRTTGLKGFAHKQSVYTDNQNPFTSGTARFIKTEKKKFKAFTEWIPTIPETGDYAVYVSYQTLPKSVTDAKYTVFHKGGATEFRVNQSIGGGTWVYLGTFPFDKGNNDYSMVVLSNESRQKGIICADAVRFGGGMGNIARDNGKNITTTSGFPRYLEGARYWAQWAGMPYSVYSSSNGNNDYTDDINVRSLMTNYLSGGSIYNSSHKGLGIPFEMSMGIHSDAGYTHNDETIGTLGIYTTEYNQGKLNSGISRYASRDLADIVLTGLQKDIQSNFDIQWNRRSMWDKNYSETRLPEVASMIVELLSHQNFADMKLGHDPNFKFTVGRSLYKSILRYITSQHGVDYEVQPLPVSHFAIEFGKKKNTVHLSWRGENDPIEPTAKPKEYIVYTRLGYGGFDNGIRVKTPFLTLEVEPGLVYSFKITAVNKGGESFPSETLSAYISPRHKETILIVNGFDRLSAPASINTPDSLGFDPEKDPGVSYMYNTSLCGVQTGYERKNAGKETIGGLGFSTNEFEGIKIAGNTFDYPFIHGKAIQASGNYSFVSCSDEAVESKRINLNNYPIVDLILGLEKEDKNSNSIMNKDYKCFSAEMQYALASYCQNGGNIMVSGSYIGSDMNTITEKAFTREVLKYTFGGTAKDTHSGKIFGLGLNFSISKTVNEELYSVPSPEIITPEDTAFSIFAYSDNHHSAGIAYKSSYRTFILGFPFESITSELERSKIMAAALNFFGK